ncbi:N-acetylglucosamine-6-sulfatase-like [Actinia tenebrosa]|uniref:N-acetylglucosamine-6-sulfatase-like n=1 Tax=Actinia tenebrosa TaxID=6105 RepID=A0A6P8H2R4_ACTTE|nr:N-acetylglucosamine-6-sulfatase-like [Actinia tenebrosa]
MKKSTFLVLVISCLFAYGRNSVTAKKPNIVLILTDDQDTILEGMSPMIKTKKLIQEKGISFENMFVTSPLCCPSRSSILTGMYTHNHHAINNSVEGNCASNKWQRESEKQTMNTFLKAMGYGTLFAGKYLNQYGINETGGPQHVPPGWDKWYGLVGNSKYYKYTLSVNGKPEVHESDYKKDYLTDVISRYATSFIQSRASSSSPFFMFLSTPACHAPFTPAPQYKDMFNTSKAPRTPSFDVAGGKTKHWLIRQTPHPMAKSSIDFLDNAFRNRLRTLLSVDDLVEQVVTMLDKTKQLQNTFIIFTSDNGYHLGQFSLPVDKRQLYEFDIRVPFLIRGPGLKANKTLQSPILNIDIAPTIIELAGGQAPKTMDGRSIVPLLNDSNVEESQEDNKVKVHDAAVKWREDFLVQHSGEGKMKVEGCPKLEPGFESCEPDCVCEDTWNNTYSCLRKLSSSQNFMFCEFRDKEVFMEYYDMTKDPHQLSNIAKKVNPRVLVPLHKRLEALTMCAGDTCRQEDDNDDDT